MMPSVVRVPSSVKSVTRAVDCCCVPSAAVAVFCPMHRLVLVGAEVKYVLEEKVKGHTF